MPTDVPISGASSPPFKIMALRRPGTCACGIDLAVGERAAWDRAARTVRCLPCVQADPLSTPTSGPAVPDSDHSVPEVEPATPVVPAVIEVGMAGGSAQQEFARRHAKREDRIRAAHPKLGGLILAVSDDPQSTTAWKSGAVGERKLGDKLAGLGETIIALHDRQVPKSRANIDHVVVGPAGVYVIDAKRYKNAKIAVRRSGGILKPATTQLMVSGRDKTQLVEAMAWQVAAVRAALAASSEFVDAPITAALCFVDAEFPFFGTIEIGDVRVRGLGGTAKLVSAAGPFDAAGRDRLARHLAAQLPAKLSK